MRIIVDLATLDDGNALVEQAHESTDDTRFPLSPFTKKDHMMTGQNGIFDFRYNRFIIADDSWQDALAGLQAMDEVFPHLLAHR